MAKRCQITGIVMTGNNVSHANNKTRRRFLPNLQHATMHSEALGRRAPSPVDQRDADHRKAWRPGCLSDAGPQCRACR